MRTLEAVENEHGQFLDSPSFDSDPKITATRICKPLYEKVVKVKADVVAILRISSWLRCNIRLSLSDRK